MQRDLQGEFEVLVVDDERHVRHILRTVLGACGLNCRTAPDGLAGWQALRESLPDLLITDIEMPRWNGLELLTTIRTSETAQLAELPVLVCSTLSDQRSIDSVFAAGADGFVAKPISLPVLKSKTNELLPMG